MGPTQLIPPGRKILKYNGVAVGEYVSTGDAEADARVALKFFEDNGYPTEMTEEQLIYGQALAFAETAARLYEQGLMGTARNARSVTPLIVNAAFAIELYLKALAKKHGVTPLREHELTKLYAALPDAALQGIASVTPQCAAKRTLGEAPNLQRYLASLNKAFVQWRYWYERDYLPAVHIQQVIFAMEVLHSAAGLSPRADATT